MTIEEKAKQDLSKFADDASVVLYIAHAKEGRFVGVSRRGGIKVADLRRKAVECGGLVRFAIWSHNRTVPSPQLDVDDVASIEIEEYC